MRLGLSLSLTQSSPRSSGGGGGEAEPFAMIGFRSADYQQEGSPVAVTALVGDDPGGGIDFDAGNISIDVGYAGEGANFALSAAITNLVLGPQGGVIVYTARLPDASAGINLSLYDSPDYNTDYRAIFFVTEGGDVRSTLTGNVIVGEESGELHRLAVRYTLTTVAASMDGGPVTQIDIALDPLPTNVAMAIFGTGVIEDVDVYSGADKSDEDLAALSALT